MPLVAVVFLLASVLQLLTPTLASADAASRLGPVNDKYYGARFLRDCLAQKTGKQSIAAGDDSVMLTNITSAVTGVDIGRWMEPDSGHIDCNNGDKIKNALTALGLSSVGDYLIKVGYAKGQKDMGEVCTGPNYNPTCRQTTIDVYTISGNDTANALVDSMGQIPAAKFYAYQAIFNANCELSTTITGNGAAVTHRQVVEEPANSGKFVAKDVPSEFPALVSQQTENQAPYRVTTKTDKEGNARKGIPKFDYNGQNTTCRDLLGLLNGMADAVARWDNDNKEDAVTSATGVNNQGECNSQSPNWNAETNTCGEDAPTCTDQIKGIGWLICPTMEFLANVLDYSYGFLAGNFLQVDTSLVKGAEAPWARFKDIANIAFVIALLFVIYSQVTSVGISNYGIKKMLPKIIVAALLVNLSYIICQVAVDLSNILGYGISRFFTGLDIGGSATNTSAGKALESAGLALNATAAIGLILVAGVGLAMAISFPVILATLLAVAMIALILIARKALIVLLIVVAPLAFVAYLLPNTEQWFKKWAKMFSTLLLLFPLIGVVFGASALAAKIVASAAKDDPLIQLTAIAIAGLPFFVVPGLLKGALSAAGALGTKLSGLADRAGKGVGSSVKNRSQLGQTYQAAMKYREQKHLAGLAKKRGTGLNSVIGRVAGGKDYNAKARLRASDLEASEFEEDVKSATNSFKPEDHDDVISMAQYGKKLDGTRVSEAEQVAAIRYAGKSGSSSDVAKINSIGQSGRVRSAHIDAVKDKKLNNVVGNKVLTEIAKGGTDGDRFNNLVVEAANNGTIAAATIAQSDSTPKFIADAINTNAKSTDQNAVKLTSQGHQNLQKATDQAYNTPATRAAMTGQMGADLRSININTP